MNEPVWINGRRYPMWQGIVDQKRKFYNCTIIEHDNDVGDSVVGKVVDVVLRANGTDSAWFAFVTDTGVECGGDVKYLGVAGTPEADAFVLRSSFGSSWAIKHMRPALRAVP